MISNILVPGIKIDLTTINRSNIEKEEKHYSSKLLDIMDESTIKITMPLEGGRLIPLDIGTGYKIFFYTGRTMYQCKGTIMERLKEGVISVMVVHLDSDLQRYQRREYYRLTCRLEISYHPVTKEEVAVEKRLEANNFKSDEEKERFMNTLIHLKNIWFTGAVVDLSGGGMKFNSEQAHELGTVMQVRIDFPINGTLTEHIISSKIIESIPLLKRFGFYENRVRFEGMDLMEREALIKYIFDEERKQRRNERGMGY